MLQIARNLFTHLGELSGRLDEHDDFPIIHSRGFAVNIRGHSFVDCLRLNCDLSYPVHVKPLYYADPSYIVLNDSSNADGLVDDNNNDFTISDDILSENMNNNSSVSMDMAMGDDINQTLFKQDKLLKKLRLNKNDLRPDETKVRPFKVQSKVKVIQSKRKLTSSDPIGEKMFENHTKRRLRLPNEMIEKMKRADTERFQKRQASIQKTMADIRRMAGQLKETFTSDPTEEFQPTCFREKEILEEKYEVKSKSHEQLSSSTSVKDTNIKSKSQGQLLTNIKYSSIKAESSPDNNNEAETEPENNDNLDNETGKFVERRSSLLDILDTTSSPVKEPVIDENCDYSDDFEYDSDSSGSILTALNTCTSISNSILENPNFIEDEIDRKYFGHLAVKETKALLDLSQPELEACQGHVDVLEISNDIEVGSSFDISDPVCFTGEYNTSTESPNCSDLLETIHNYKDGRSITESLKEESLKEEFTIAGLPKCSNNKWPITNSTQREPYIKPEPRPRLTFKTKHSGSISAKLGMHVKCKDEEFSTDLNTEVEDDYVIQSDSDDVATGFDEELSALVKNVEEEITGESMEELSDQSSETDSIDGNGLQVDRDASNETIDEDMSALLESIERYKHREEDSDDTDGTETEESDHSNSSFEDDFSALVKDVEEDITSCLSTLRPSGSTYENDEHMESASQSRDYNSMKESLSVASSRSVSGTMLSLPKTASKEMFGIDEVEDFTITVEDVDTEHSENEEPMESVEGSSVLSSTVVDDTVADPNQLDYSMITSNTSYKSAVPSTSDTSGTPTNNVNILVNQSTSSENPTTPVSNLANLMTQMVISHTDDFSSNSDAATAAIEEYSYAMQDSIQPVQYSDKSADEGSSYYTASNESGSTIHDTSTNYLTEGDEFRDFESVADSDDMVFREPWETLTPGLVLGYAPDDLDLDLAISSTHIEHAQKVPARISNSVPSMCSVIESLKEFQVRDNDSREDFNNAFLKGISSSTLQESFSNTTKRSESVTSSMASQSKDYNSMKESLSVASSRSVSSTMLSLSKTASKEMFGIDEIEDFTITVEDVDGEHKHSHHTLISCPSSQEQLLGRELSYPLILEEAEIAVKSFDESLVHTQFIRQFPSTNATRITTIK